MLGFGNLPERFSLAGLAHLLNKNPELKIKVRASDIYHENDNHINDKSVAE